MLAGVQQHAERRSRSTKQVRRPHHSKQQVTKEEAAAWSEDHITQGTEAHRSDKEEKQGFIVVLCIAGFMIFSQSGWVAVLV